MRVSKWSIFAVVAAALFLTLPMPTAVGLIVLAAGITNALKVK